MGLLTLQAIFCHHSPAYDRTHPVPAHVRKAAHAIMRCRPAALGGHVQSCPEGHISRLWYNSCRHRSCPQWAFLQSERWCATHKARLLDCEHSHRICTIPHDLHPVWQAKVALRTSLLFTAVRDTLFTLLGEPKYLGAQPGIIAGLHTWGQTLVCHPHIHCGVTGGGLSPAGQWIAVRNGYLLPGRVVMAVLRGKLLDALRRAWSRGTLQLPPGRRPQPFLNRRNRLGHKQKTRWNVRIMARDPHGHGVATSLARSLRGGPLKNARRVAWDDQAGTFRYQDHHGRTAAGTSPPMSMTLSPDECLRRLLWHVPPPHTPVVRCYGLYHPSQATALAQRRTALGQPSLPEPVALDWQTFCAQRGDAPPEQCPRCGQRLVGSALIPRGGAPPEREYREDAA